MDYLESPVVATVVGVAFTLILALIGFVWKTYLTARLADVAIKSHAAECDKRSVATFRLLERNSEDLDTVKTTVVRVATKVEALEKHFTP